MRVLGPVDGPPDPGVLSALDYLRSFRLGAPDCVAYLDEVASLLGRLELFRALFPGEFEKIRPTALHVEDEHVGHTQGELRFVELLKQWFPIDEAMEEMPGGFNSVPVFTRVHDQPETLEDVEYLRLGLRVGVVLMNFVEVGTELLECLPLGAEAFETLRIASPYNVSFERLAALCEAELSPLRHLHTSLRIARRVADNIWFDGFCTCGECGSSIEWTEENLRVLAEMWSAADEVYERIGEFEEWIGEDPEARMAAVIELWNRAELPEGGQHGNDGDQDRGPR